MYLVMENPVSRMHVGEVVYFKVHALCDKSAAGLVGPSAVVPSTLPGAALDQRESRHGTLFLTNFRLLFLAFERSSARGRDAQHAVVEVPLNNVAELAECRVTSASGKAANMTSQLEIACKNFEIVKFNFPCDATSGCVRPLELLAVVWRGH